MVLKKFSTAFVLAGLSAVPLVSAQQSYMIMGGLKPIAYERIDPVVNPGVVSNCLILCINFF